MAEVSAKSVYPTLVVPHIQNPNRMWAFPFFGGLAKIIILIPQFFLLFFIAIAVCVVTLINSFVVLFTGKYWDPSYELNLNFMRLSTKVSLFFYGLTDKYPGFDFNMPPGFELNFAKPTAPNRFFAIPLLGGIARTILMIPFLIYMSVIQYAAQLGVVVASLPVLFTGKYPESFYEIARDSVRLSNAVSVYFIGASDNYPSFSISMNHKTTKIVLIVIASLYLIFNYGVQALSGGFEGQEEALQEQYQQQFQQQYQQQYEQMMQDAQDGEFDPSQYNYEQQ